MSEFYHLREHEFGLRGFDLASNCWDDRGTVPNIRSEKSGKNASVFLGGHRARPSIISSIKPPNFSDAKIREKVKALRAITAFQSTRIIRPTRGSGGEIF